MLANALGQVRRCHGLIFFAGERAPTVDPDNLRTCGMRESVGAGLLANRVVHSPVRRRNHRFRQQAGSYGGLWR